MSIHVDPSNERQPKPLNAALDRPNKLASHLELKFEQVVLNADFGLLTILEIIVHSLNVRDERYVCDFLDMYDSPNVFSSNVCRALANYTRNDDVIDTHLLGGLAPTWVVYKIVHWAERNAVMYVMVWGIFCCV